MTRLKKRGHAVNLQILDNKASQAYIQTIQDTWGCTFQLVSPHVHQRNIAERAIRTFKARFLAILSGISDSSPNYLWDHLLPQTELTLSLLRQSTLIPEMSAWEHLHGPINFDATPLGPIGCPRHRPHQARHPKNMGLPRPQRVQHWTRTQTLPLLPRRQWCHQSAPVL